MVSAESGRGASARRCVNICWWRPKTRGFLAMQFNFVVAANARAVRLWQRMGFDIVGRVPDAFLHPSQGMSDALVMYRKL